MEFSPERIAKLQEFGTAISLRLVGMDRPMACGRDRELTSLAHHFEHASHNSALLVGPSGCGKSAILYEFFRRISQRSHDTWMVLETSCAMLLAGTHYLGEWETRVRELCRAAQREERVAIYFTDFSSLISAGRSANSNHNFASALAPVIERGEIVVFGECTEELFHRSVEPNPWFNKLFGTIRVAPQDPDAVRQVIQHLVDRHNESLSDDLDVELQWDDAALEAVEQFGRLYFVGACPPGGAARLMEQIVSAKRAALQAMSRRPSRVDVKPQDCVQSLEAFSGIPSLLLDDTQALQLASVREYFRSRVIGQDDAVETIVDLIALIKAGLTDPKKPLGVLFFVGPTGVGKTELAKVLAEFIFGSSGRMLRYDMSEFADYNSSWKLIGAPSSDGDARAGGGSLLQRIRSQPFSLILLDEIEKAHANIFDLLLQLFDDARLSDSQGNTANFTQSIIILTSNLGSEISEGGSFGFGQSTEIEDSISTAMKSYFRPELINRIDHIVRFKPLSRDHVRTLARRELGEVLLRSGILRRQLRVDVDRGVIDILAEAGFHPAYGARPLKRAVERLALTPIAREIAGITDENRPAMLRLLPAGNRIVLKVVADRQSRDTKSMARGVRWTNPTNGKTTKLTPADLDAQCQHLRTLVDDLEAECAGQRLAAQKAALVARTAQVNFWDEADAAREAMSDLYRLERILESVKHLRHAVDKAEQRREELRKSPSETAVRRFAQELMAQALQAEVLTYSVRCVDRIDRCDAFVAITATEPLEKDLVGQLADMYVGWARRKGFEARIVNEELFSRDASRELVILIEGVAVYGLLRSEQGLHEFVEKEAKTREREWFVKVHVLPVLDHPGDRRPAVVATTTARGAAPRSKRFRTQVTATDGDGRSVVLRNGLEAEEAEQVARELLDAEIWRVQQLHLHDPHDVIRRYVLSPSQSVKDLRTGITTHRLDELFRGALDEFLAAALERRLAVG